MQSIIGKGTLVADAFLVTSFRAKSRNLPCPAVIHVSVKMKIDVFVFRFPAVSRRPFMGLPERSLGCTRDDETGSGWFLTRFQIAAIHPLPSVCPSSARSQRGGMPEGLRRAFFSYRQHYTSGECYSVKRQNVLGSPSGELPEGERGQHYGISNIVRWPLACPYCLRHFPRRGYCMKVLKYR